MSAGPLGVAPPSSDQSARSSEPLAGSLCTSSSAPAAPALDSAVSGLSFFIEGEYPKSVTATPKLSHPIAGPPATWTGTGLVFGMTFRRREFRAVVILVCVVVPEPVLARLERPNDRVPAAAPVRRRMSGQ